MPWLLGIDEAGYGPTLGPLVIGSSLWHIDSPDACPDFAPWENGFHVPSGHHIRIADSKELYSTASGLAALELGLHASLATLDWCSSSLRDLFARLTECDWPAQSPWYADWQSPSSVTFSPDELNALGLQAKQCWRDSTIRLIRVGARVVEPDEFNTLCAKLGNKSNVLSDLSLRLAARMLSDTSDRVEIYCDKHGGRNHYAAVLQHHWPDGNLSIVSEGRAKSIYLLDEPARQCRWNFTAKGDRYVPTALASMIAKYLRERLMEAFNAYWRMHCGDQNLKATAGYPQDAIRFLEAIEPVRARLQIPLESLKRCR